MKYKIIVTQISKKLTDPEDRQQTPAGFYTFESETPEEALDLFHSTIPIGCLEDFEINIEPINMHTSGPWKLEITKDMPYKGRTVNWWTILQDSGDFWVLEGPILKTAGELENLALITAAPDLLKAADELLSHFNKTVVDLHALQNALQALERASSKAREDIRCQIQ